MRWLASLSAVLAAALLTSPAEAKSGDAQDCIVRSGGFLYNHCGAAITLFYCYYTAGAVNEGYRCPRFNRVMVPNNGSQYMLLPSTGAYALPQPQWGGCILPAQTQFFRVGAGGFTYTCSLLPDDRTSELSEVCKSLVDDPNPASTTINRCRSAGYDMSKFDRPPVTSSSNPELPPKVEPNIPKPEIPLPSVPPELQKGVDAKDCIERPPIPLGYDDKTCLGFRNQCTGTIHIRGCWDGGSHDDDGYKCPQTGTIMLTGGQTSASCVFGGLYPGTTAYWAACYDPSTPHDPLYVPGRGFAYNCARD